MTASGAPTIVNQPATETKKKPLNIDDLVGLKGQNAPPFTLLSMDGTEYNLEKLRGKIVVINLWETFCPPSITEMPELNALVEKYKDKEIVFLAPAPDEKAVLEGFLQKHPFSYQVLPNGFNIIKQYAPHKKSDDLQKKSGFIMLLPTHLVIDQTGVVTYHEWGFRKDTVNKLSGEIEKLLSKAEQK
ncbi:MAG: TlpA family protein disulfide reductase [Pyrinomonadaceae bacterium]